MRLNKFGTVERQNESQYLLGKKDKRVEERESRWSSRGGDFIRGEIRGGKKKEEQTKNGAITFKIY